MTEDSYRKEETPTEWVVVRGGKYGKPAPRRKPMKREATRTALQRFSDSEFHAYFVGVVGSNGHVPSEGIYDIRRYRQFPGRYLTRRIEEMADAGVEDAKLDELPKVVAAIVEEAKRRRRLGTIPTLPGAA